MSAHRYAALGMAVVLVALTLVLFSDESMQEDPDMTGIVSDVKEGANGYTFTLNTYDGSTRCFFRERPADLSYCGVSGTFSDDGSILFVDRLVVLERCPHHQ